MCSHMISAYRNMFAVWAVAVLCLVPVCHSAPLACDDLVQTLDQLDPRDLEGRWVMVAGSLKITEALRIPKDSDSIRIDFYNSTYTQASRIDGKCYTYSLNASIQGHSFRVELPGIFNFSGTFFHTSCPDCVLFKMVVDSPDYKSVELYLFSKRREVNQTEMQEFVAQVECLKMPKHFVMDPTKELCPDRTSAAALTETKD